jgi:HAD superfamily hydrolase (TIGR01509 family)
MIAYVIEAVIFDRDGVLIDSEYTNVQSGELAFKKLGVDLTKEEKKSIVGRHVDDYSEPILKKHNLDYGKFRDIQRELYYEILKSTPVFNKTIDLLKQIHTLGIKVALCTSSSKKSTNSLLISLGIKDLFQEIVTTEDYSSRKPNPEPYIVTATKLGLKPSDCLVVEDSEVGLKAALNAGMKCVIIYNAYTMGHDFRGAVQVVDSADKIDISALIK